MRKTIVAIAIVLFAITAVAEVTDSAANGFTTVNEVVINTERAKAWVDAINVGMWWSPDHTISGDATRLSIQPTPLGCFCETLGDAAGIVHLTVTSVMPMTLLRLTGGLGPLGLRGVDGNMIWEFEDAGEATRVRFSYAVGGYMAGGLDQVAEAVDFVIGEALHRLKAYAETDDPEPAASD
jgi:hypothetical protein